MTTGTTGEKKLFFGKEFIATMTLPPSREKDEAVVNLIQAFRVAIRKEEVDRKEILKAILAKDKDKAKQVKNQQTNLVCEVENLLLNGSEEVKQALDEFVEDLSPGFEKTI